MLVTYGIIKKKTQPYLLKYYKLIISVDSEIQQMQHKLIFPFLLFEINKGPNSQTPVLQVLAGLINNS